MGATSMREGSVLFIVVHTFRFGKAGSCTIDRPFILGHEASGIVEETGARVTHLKKGDRVVMEPGIPCCKCEFCLKGLYHLCPDLRFWAAPPHDGCLMNYVAHPASFTFKLPDHVSLREGALVEPLAVGLSAADKGNIQVGETVVVLGAGCIGLVTLMVARTRGASKVIITDVLPNRLEMAQKLGAIAVNAGETDAVSEILRLTNGRGADIVVDCCGRNQTVQQCIQIARPYGRIILVGLAETTLKELPMFDFVDKELTFAAVRRYHNQFPIAIDMIANRMVSVERLITHEYPFENTPFAFEDCIRNASDVIKGMILFES